MYGRAHLYGGFLKWWYPTTIGFPTKNNQFGVFWGCHHFRKHPYGGGSWRIETKKLLTSKTTIKQNDEFFFTVKTENVRKFARSPHSTHTDTITHSPRFLFKKEDLTCLRNVNKRQA